MTKTALVTGANRGIGLEVCRGLARAGYVVLLSARQRAHAESAAADLRGGVGDVRAVALDVSSEQSVAELAERALAERWKLDALVNNAGVSLRGFDAETAAATLETNFWGPMRVSDALLSALVDGANVVNVSSGMGELSGFGPQLRRRFESARERAQLLELAAEFLSDVRARCHSQKGWPSNAYSVSKALLNAFTRVFAAEQPRLRVNAVCPGWVRTDMGGRSAPRSISEGAAGIIWAATQPQGGPTGGFFRDRRSIPW